MNNSLFHIGLIQMTSSCDIGDNLNKAEQLIAQAAEQGAQMVVLPETFALMEKYQGQKLEHIEVDGVGIIQDWLSKTAKQFNVAVVGGTIAVDSGLVNKPFARCYVYDNHGQVITHYDKIHMFDVSVGEQESYSESEHTQSGRQPQTFQFRDITFGLSVCYDLRFPELYRQYQDQNVQVVLAPSAFTMKTGERHWQLLLQARAVENLVFVAAANQTGTHDNQRQTFGHSMVVEPWGEVLSSLDFAEGVLVQALEVENIERIKRGFPVHLHKKLT